MNCVNLDLETYFFINLEMNKIQFNPLFRKMTNKIAFIVEYLFRGKGFLWLG